MAKSSKPKKKQEADIHVGGSVIGDNIVIGSHNKITFQEVLKTTYGLFTIPQPVTDFTGREEELAQLKASFEKGTIISGLSGSGGVGKTELARKLAHEIADHFPDAQMNVDLLGTSEKPTSPEDVIRHLLEPFYVGQKLPDDETQLKGLYQQTFANKKALLLLDNAANAAQVRPLIPPAPSAAIITSRQHFSLTEFGMHEPLRLDVLSPDKASELLRGASPKLNDASVEEVIELAKLCGHLPLALRVAASLLNDRPDWTVATLLHRLQDEHMRLKRLKREGDYDVEAMLNLSYELLDDGLKKYFRALGIFTAPFAKISALTVLGIEDEDDLDDVLGKLLGRNFLNSQTSQGVVETLYSLHDLTRLYATEKLLEEKEYEETLIRYAEHFLMWASDTDDLYKKGNENILVGLTQFRFIWIHLYSSYERLLPEQKKRPQSADLWLSIFLEKCNNVLKLSVSPLERLNISHEALEAARRLGDKQYQGINLNYMGNAQWELGNIEKAIEFYERGLIINREIGNRRGEGNTLGNLGNAYTYLGNGHKALEFQETALAIYREIGDQREVGVTLGNLGIIYESLGDTQKAIEFYEQSLVIAHKNGDRRGEAAVYGNIGIAYASLGEIQKAIEFHEKDLLISHEIRDREYEVNALGNLGKSYITLGKTTKAILFFEQQLTIVREIGNRQIEGEILVDLGIAHANLGNTRKSIECFEMALLIARETDDKDLEESLDVKISIQRSLILRFFVSFARLASKITK